MKDRFLPLLKPGLTASIVISALAAAFVTGNGSLPIKTLLLLGVAAFLASSGSCVMNHFLDRDIDAVMERTRKRPLPSGGIKHPRRVFWSGLALISVSLILSQLFLNSLVTLHLFMGAFVYVVIYTVWLKKRSVLNIVIGGLAGSFAVMAGGASVRPELCLPPLLVGLIIFLWTPSHFWSFAIARRRDYHRARVPMLPVVIGDKRTAYYILGNTILLITASIFPVFLGVFGGLYLAAAIAVGAFFMMRNLQLLFHTTEKEAAKNFQASMIYLMTLLLAMIADAVLISSPTPL
jgi:protoheme IX farnesyltransferase